MKTVFEVITLAEAITKYSIDEEVLDMMNAEAKVYLYKGELVMEEDFILNLDTIEKDIEGFIIDGNLQVNGSIINEEGDYGPMLYVNGNVSCLNLLIGGSPTQITGNVTAAEVIMLHYNHGWMKCPGVFKAPVMIVEDYHFRPAQREISDFYYNDREEGCGIEPDFAALFNNKLTSDFEELRYDLAAGESVLQPIQRDAQYWVRKVQHNYRDLKRVPLEFRSMELCMQALHKSVSALEDFPPAFFTPEVIEKAVNKSGMALRYMPEALITRELCYKAAANGAILDLDIPEHFYETDLFFILIRANDWQMERVPVAYITEDLLVAYVKLGRGAWLDKYCSAAGVSKERVLQRVMEDGVEYLENIFGWHFSKETYGYGKALYGNREEWGAITEKYKKKLERL